VILTTDRLFHIRSTSREQDSQKIISNESQSQTTESVNFDQPKGFVTPDFYTKGKGQLVATYYEAFKPVLLRITKEEGYTPYDTYNFIMGKPELREKVTMSSYVI
jgi:hypothetical protein